MDLKIRIVVERGPDKSGPAHSTGGAWGWTVFADDLRVGQSSVYYETPDAAEKAARVLFKTNHPITIDRSKGTG